MSSLLVIIIIIIRGHLQVFTIETRHSFDTGLTDREESTEANGIMKKR